MKAQFAVILNGAPMIRLASSAALWWGLFAGLASPAVGQRTIWEHIGDGYRTQEPGRFRVISDLSGDGLPEVLIPGKFETRVEPGDGGPPLATHQYQRYNHGHGIAIEGGYADLGDLTGDGISEYSASARGYHTGWLPNAGLVMIYNGVTHTVENSIVGNVAGGRLGDGVVPLGDVNGDGYLDLGVLSQAWFVRIYTGPDWTFYREEEATRICALGDVDGDGMDDYAASNSSYGPPFGGQLIGQGRVMIRSGANGAMIADVIGMVEWARLGVSIQNAGDWNGDGVNDIAAGAPGSYSGDATPAVHILSGSDGSFLHTIDPSATVARKASFGVSLGAGQDVNGDGFPDLVVGASDDRYEQPQFVHNVRQGAALVYSGASGALLWYERGVHPGQQQGYRVQLIEDFSGDGVAEWATLSPEYDVTPESSSTPKEGRLTIFSGAVGDAISHCTAGTNSIGKEARLWNPGPISVKQNRFELGVSDMPPSQTAILIHGQLAPANPFGVGELCIGSPVSVLDVVTSPPVGNLARSRHLDLEAAPFTDGGNVVRAGDRWAFQALYRDGTVHNTSNALEVTFLP